LAEIITLGSLRRVSEAFKCLTATQTNGLVARGACWCSRVDYRRERA